MKCWGILLLIIAALMQDVVSQQSITLEASLCDKHNPNNSAEAASTSDPKNVLQKGYTQFKNSVTAAENIAIKGMQLASELVIGKPKDAAEAIRKYMQESEDLFYDSGLLFFFGIGKAVSLCYPGKPVLAEASLKLQVAALEVLDEMGTSVTLSIQGTEIGGDAGREAIRTALLSIEAAFDKLYYEIPLSLEQAIGAVSDAKICQAGPDHTKNADAVKSIVISASIIEIEKAAEDAIKQGSSASKVNWLKESVKISLADLNEVASDENNSYARIQALANTDPSLAKDTYLKEDREFVRRIHLIFANIFLDYAASAASSDSDSSAMKEIGAAIRIMEHGNGDVIVAEGISKHLTLLALEQKDSNVREELLNAGKKNLNFKIITLDKCIVTSAIRMFKVL